MYLKKKENLILSTLLVNFTKVQKLKISYKELTRFYFFSGDSVFYQ
jgi:hypothetical protein